MENKITPPQATPTDNSGLSIDYLVISSPSDTLPYQNAIKEAPLLVFLCLSLTVRYFSLMEFPA